MSEKIEPGEMQMIPLDRIDVLNPRERNKGVFDEIVGNIKAIGLKKPITVTPRKGPDGSERYLLICGEGRMKAFRSLGEKTIPALVVAVSDENAFIMSLAENIARRQYRPLELLAGIEQLRDQGYDKKIIAQKTGLTVEYVQGILILLKNGEERLLVAVEKGRIPLNAALTIVGAGDGRVGMWRGRSRLGLSVAAPFVWRCPSTLTLTPFPHPPSSNRTCRFPASGSRTRLHAFAHATLRPRALRRTSPKDP